MRVALTFRMSNQNNHPNRDQGANRNMERQEKPGVVLDHERERQEAHPQSTSKSPKEQQSPVERSKH